MDISPTPVLSICIPAYRFEKGVRRIIDVLHDSPRLEILISEDWSEHPLDLSDLFDLQSLTHKVNPKPNGAIANWNMVMSWAKGKYVWLLHHDEEPVFPDGLEAFLDSLEQPDAPCILLSHLELRDRLWQRALRSDLVRQIFLCWPRLVLLHNPIGALSNVIVHRNIIEPFDERLKWFVDTEWYFRVLAKYRNAKFSQFDIHTHAYDGSITQGMNDEIAEIALREIEIVCDEHEIGDGFRKLWRGKLKLFERIKKALER